MATPEKGNCNYNCSLLQEYPLVPPGECPGDLNCTCTFNVQIPGVDGTVPMTLRWWRCGHRVYNRLTREWTGICVPLYLPHKNALRLETIYYHLQSFTNVTHVTLKGIRTELLALRLTTMQNSKVLDLLTASQGGI